MQGITVAYNIITGTKHQDLLNKWRYIHTITCNESELGQVRYKYWLNIEKRNSDKIITRKGKKLKSISLTGPHTVTLIRCTSALVTRWFIQMLQNYYRRPCGQIKKAPVLRSTIFLFKVTHKILRPDMILSMDEVRSDTSHGVIGGDMFVCDAGTTMK